MTIQRLREYAPFFLRQRTACRAVTSLMFLVLIAAGAGKTASDEVRVVVQANDGYSINRAASISAGFYHTCGVRDTGAVECWGDDGLGQSTPPTGIFTAVTAGDYHTCGLRKTGAVECWGSDYHGQSTPPTGTFISVTAGDDYTCGLRATVAMACWGGRAYGVVLEDF